MPSTKGLNKLRRWDIQLIHRLLAFQGFLFFMREDRSIDLPICKSIKCVIMGDAHWPRAKWISQYRKKIYANRLSLFSIHLFCLQFELPYQCVCGMFLSVLFILLQSKWFHNSPRIGEIESYKERPSIELYFI